jgi:hypothetical protein
MSEQTHESAGGIGDDLGLVETNGEVVHWMRPRPLSLGPAGISAAAAGAFALGAVTAVAVLAMLHWLGPQRDIEAPRRWRFKRAA